MRTSSSKSTTMAIAHLRFGDGELGLRRRPGWAFKATYRVGNGYAGKSGQSRSRILFSRALRSSGIRSRVRNPLPALGGT